MRVALPSRTSMGVGDGEEVAFGGLIDDAGTLESFDEGEATAIHARDFGAGEFDFEVVDFEACDGGHAMFDGFDGVGAGFDGGAAGALGDVLNEGGDADGTGEIGADEDDAVADGGGLEGEGGRGACKETLAGEADDTGDGFLGATDTHKEGYSRARR